ncbi:unnamed protein product [Polarella glacialis]|nr:unnamed protein product [Polarella glacialis]
MVVSELQLDSARQAELASLGELTADEALRMVGRAGEEAAASAFERMGYEVVWVNRLKETLWPFDLVICKLTDGGKAAGLANMFRQEGSEQREKDRKRLEKALQDPQTILVEVKASLAEERDVFDVSSAQLACARQLGPRFWLARLRDLAGPKARLDVLPDLNSCLCQGRLRLLMIA